MGLPGTIPFKANNIGGSAMRLVAELDSSSPLLVGFSRRFRGSRFALLVGKAPPTLFPFRTDSIMRRRSAVWFQSYTEALGCRFDANDFISEKV
jgi:hypothetical protein